MIKGDINRATLLASFPAWGPSISYSFYETVSDLPGSYQNQPVPLPDLINGSTPKFDDPGIFQPFTASERTYVVDVLHTIDDFIAVTFSAATGAPAASDLTFGALNYYNSAWASPGKQIATGAATGDVWLTNPARQSAGVDFPGTVGGADYFINTIPHEIGHALGLDHTFGVGLGASDTDPAEENSHKFSIMAYQPHAADHSATWEFQLYDIASLQKLYGRNDSYNLGATSYSTFDKFPMSSGVTVGANANRIFSIWDAGGADDTIDASGYDNSVIDLRPGYFSSIGPSSGAVVNGAINDAGVQNVSIAFGAYIENAKGGGQNDALIGNLLSNRLEGGGGNDLIYGEGRLRPDDAAPAPETYDRIKLGGTEGPGGEVAAFVGDPTKQKDKLFGEAGDDQLWGSRGDDELDGGSGSDLLYGWEGKDVVLYGSSSVGADISISPGSGPDPRIQSNQNAPDKQAVIQALVKEGNDTDTLVDIETIRLTDKSDKVKLTGDVDTFKGGRLTVEMKGAPVAFHQDEVDASGATTGIYFNLGSGSVVGLDQTADRGSLGFLGALIGVAFEPTRISITGANSAIGSDYSDILIASSGARDSGEGYSALYGGKGNDLLVGRGWESHLYGQEGDDQFEVGSNTWIEDAESHDSVSYGGIPIFGGVKQWWMEGNTAYWSPFSTLLTAFPVIGSEILYTAAFFIDVATMKFASFQQDGAGNLKMSLGWGHGGQAVIKDYNLNLDTGEASAGVVVFQSGGDGNGTNFNHSEDRFTKFVNLALKAGFGVGLNGFDPLVLDLDGDGYELTTEANSRTYFEFDSDGFGERTGWVRGDDGFLVRDANGNGLIDNVTEMFGNASTPGFAVLSGYDLNADGVIDAQDAVYAQLKVWQDRDMDGVTDAGELKSLAQLGIVSISLASTAPAEPSFIGGNRLVDSGHFTWADGRTGNLADFALDINETATRWLGDNDVGTAAAALPELKGFGEIKDLRVAMTDDPALLALVESFVAETTNDLATLKTSSEAILYEWAGVDEVAAIAIGSNGFDMRKLAFLETYGGYELMPRDANGALVTTNLAEMEALWADHVTRLTLRLIVQGPMADEFAGISYRADLDLLVADTATALEDLYRTLLEDLPSDPAAALAQWQSWAPLLGAMADGMRRIDANLVRSDYVAAQLAAAMDGIVQPLSFAQLAGALGIENLRLGTAGDDALTRAGASGMTLFVAEGGGTDTLTGGSGQDVYIFGRTIGNATINDIEAKPGGDRIRFAFLAPDDVTIRRDGYDLLITVKATGETVRVTGQFADVVPMGSDVLLSSNKGIEDIQFADGSIYEIPEIMTAVGTGTDGNDLIIGTMHSDVLIGGKGDDRLEGGDDADLYVIHAGDGHDVIAEHQSTVLLRAADLLIFGDNIAPGDISLSRAGDGGDDLIVTIGASGQTLRIEGEFGYTSLGYNDKFAPNSRIESFAFKEYGDSFGIKEVQRRLIREATSDGNDTTRGFGDSDEFFASAGNDTFIGMDGVDGYHWGAGAGNDVIDEQARYIDINVGLGGLSLIDGADTVLFDGGIVTSDLIFSRTSSAPDLTITLLSTGETLTVKNQFAGFQTGPLGPQWMDRVEWFQFSDGSRLSWQDVLLDITTGGPGNDSLWGDLYADRMDGGAGDDILSGGGLGDTYVFKLGYGHDTLVDNNPFILGTGFVTVDATPDVLIFGPGIGPSDIGFIRSGKDLTLVVGTGGDSVTLIGQDDYFHTGVFGAYAYNRIEEIRFADGTVWTWADLNEQVLALSTTPGNDVARGFMMEDRFEASAGDDVMMGGDSSDTYVFGHGSGHDIIREDVSNILYGDYDIVSFSADVTASQVSIARDGEDLILTLLNSDDTLTIDGEFAYSNWFEWWDVNEFRFADGTVWTKHDIQVKLLQATSGSDHLVGFISGDVLDGGAGNDILEGVDGGDTYLFGRGYGSDVIRETVTNANLGDNDRLVFGADVLPSQVSFQRDGDDLVISILGTADTLRVEGQFAFSNWFAWWDIERFEFANGTVLTDRDVANQIMGGTPGDDHIVGTFRSDVLDGGAGNDLLEGGDGADRYVFGRGYGQDEIRESLSNANLSENDELQFLPGVTLADLGFERVGNDLVVTILGTTDKVTIKGEFDFSNWFTWWDIDRFTFADGSVVTKDQVQQKLLLATPGADYLVGFMTGDVLDGGAGDDILEGGDGADTYLFGRGYGQDIIRETLTNANLSEDDRLVFGTGITLADLGFERVGNDLVITILGTQDKVTIEGEFSYSNWFTWWDVDHLDFADGTSLTRQDVQQIVLTGTAGNDYLVGFLDGDTIDGKAGNDLLEGGDGPDTYVFGRGYGQDEIRETLGNANLSEYDTVRFGPDIAWSDLRFARSGDDLIISIAGTNDSLTLRSQFSTINDSSSQTWWDVENFVFADGTSKSSFDIMAEMVKGTDAADNIVGFFTNDTIAGGLGNDLMDGGRGNDTYVYNMGDGNDVVSDFVYYWGSGGDTIQFGAGIAPADVTVRRSTTQSGDMVLSLAGGGSLTLTHQIDGGREWTIDLVTFADGTSWTKEQLAGFLTSGAATNGDDTIDGTTLPDEIHAGGGNDILRGNGGSDILDGGAGNDRLEGGDGNDVYQYAPGGGDDFIAEYVNYWGSFDVLKLGSGFAASNLLFARGTVDANDLVISFDNSPGTVTVDNYFVARDWGIDQIQFADGTMLTYDQVNALYYAGMATAGADVIAGSYVNDSISGLAGDDRLVGNGGDDGLTGGTGNDRLEGADGNDTYYYAPGDGDDFIAEYVNYWGSFDVVRLGAGFTAANLVISRGTVDPQDLVIGFTNAAGSITVDNYFVARDWGIDQLILADGTILGMTEINNLFFAAKATSGAETIDGSYINDSISGLGGDDRLVGNGGDDTLTGGTGNDRLEGGGGNDTYVYNMADGDDFVAEYVDYWGSYDVLQLGAGFTAANLILNRGTADSNDLVITFTNAAGSVAIDNYWVARDWGIDQVRFADGSTLSVDALNALYFGQKATAGNDVLEGGYYAETLQGLAGNDTLRGNNGNDTLNGGTGDDRLEGGNDTDTYIYAVGDGNDVVSDFQYYWGSWNVIVFGAGIAPADLRFAPSAADNSDMVISFANAAGSITIDNQVLGGREWDVDEIRFADGTVWSYATLMSEYVLRQGSATNDLIGGTNNADTLNGQAGDDTIRAFGGNDILIGSTGNDQLEGGDGTDLYRYNAGDGDDVVFDRYGARDNRLVFGAGINANDLILSRTVEDPTDLRITFKTMAGSITIDHETWSDAGVEILEFADGSTLSGAALAARIGPGSGGPDRLTGTAGADDIWALEGDDIVSGLAGDDILRGDAGNDTLAGGDGNDTLLAGAGNDILVGDARTDSGANLIVNGSFEQTGGTVTNPSWGITATVLPGWSKANSSVYELVNSGYASVPATDGGHWLDMDGAGNNNNMDISQVVSGRNAGELLTLKFDASNYTSVQSGSFDVLWNGVVVASISLTGPAMTAYSFTVAALEGNNVLGFRGTGSADGYGAALDNVRLFATASGTAGDDQLTGGLGNDDSQGGLGNDIYYFNRGDGSDMLSEQPGEGVDKIVFGSGITPGEIVFANAPNGRDVVMTFAGGSESITFLGGAANPAIGFEEFRFADGTVWDQPAIESRIARYTAGPDAITGTAGADTLHGGGGDDIVSGAAGNDSLFGDDGNDTLDGGADNDLLQGGEGDDRMILSAGSDDYRGGNGVDTLDLAAAASAATVDLAAASNQLSVGGVAGQVQGVETVLGTAYGDSLAGDASGNRLDGGAGADILVGNGGDDVLIGGLGDDVFRYSGTGNGFDSVDGGAGAADQIQALAAGTIIGLASLSGVETIAATGFANVVVAGSANADTLDFTNVVLTNIARIDGGGGNDAITGSAGNDVIAGSGGDDTLAGGAGTDAFEYSGTGNGYDAVDGGLGADTIRAMAASTWIGLRSIAGIETITGNGFADVHLTGSLAADTLNFSAIALSGIARIEGLAGDDSITGTANPDTIDGGDGNDTIVGAAGDDTLVGGDGNDIFKLAGAADGFDSIDGGLGTADVVQATAASAVLGLRSIVGVETVTSNGFAGVSIAGSAGNDNLDLGSATLTGIAKIDLGAGNDILLGSLVADIVVGGAGDDNLGGGAGNDFFEVTGTASGFDAVDGGAGTDTIRAMAAGTMIGLTSVASIDTITANGFTGVYISGSANADLLDFTNVTLTTITKIDGGAGNDTIIGWNANDTILGGAGDDTLSGGAGNDIFQFTGTAGGFDAIDGGAGTNTIQALAASTVIGLRSVTGIQTITGMTGSYIAGSGGDDTLSFLGVTLNTITRIEGGAGNDTITGNNVANTLWGGLGNDVLSGDAGTDTLVGDDGDDVLIGGLGNDTINGANGIDTVDYSSATAAWTVNLSLTSAQGKSGSETDTITNVENVTGGAGADIITGTTAINLLKGNGGNDRITGGGGNDSIDGGIGTDVAVFAGLQASYSIVTSGGTIQIVDNQAATDGNDGTDTLIATEKAEFKGGVQVALAAPIILDLDGDGLTLVNRDSSAARFDWDGDGHRDRTGWMGAGDGLLVYDRDGNGTVSGAGELSFVNDRPGARSDLDGLRAFDSNGDGSFSAADLAWADFRIWNDRDGDGSVDSGEFLTLMQAGVVSISLAGTATEQSWAMDDNIVVNHGQFLRSDGTTGSLGDVALNYVPADHRPVARADLPGSSAWTWASSAASGGHPWQERHIDDPDFRFRFDEEDDGAEGMSAVPAAGGFGEDGGVADPAAMIVPFGLSGDLLVTDQALWL